MNKENYTDEDKMILHESRNISNLLHRELCKYIGENLKDLTANQMGHVITVSTHILFTHSIRNLALACDTKQKARVYINHSINLVENTLNEIMSEINTTNFAKTIN